MLTSLTDSGGNYTPLAGSGDQGPIAENPSHVKLVTFANAGAEQPITTKSTLFRKAWFYGYKAVDPAGGAPTANSAIVMVGSKSHEGNIYCVDPVVAAVGEPTTFPSEESEGAVFDLSNFYATTTSAGDGLFIKWI